MEDNNRLEKAREMFSKDLYATKLSGITVEEVGENYAKCAMKLTDDHRNAYGGIMGGAIYTLADLAFAVASNFDRPASTVSLVGNAVFLSMTKGSILYAETKLIKEGKTNCFYEVRIYDDLGKDIANVTFTGAHINRRYL
ncbi:MAG: PaaI family thioesterase [Lachnospiraceae bacterium]|nr:PaaI family thioesterase [Lachnospiraceae bacterium]